MLVGFDNCCSGLIHFSLKSFSYICILRVGMLKVYAFKSIKYAWDPLAAFYSILYTGHFVVMRVCPYTVVVNSLDCLLVLIIVSLRLATWILCHMFGLWTPAIDVRQPSLCSILPSCANLVTCWIHILKCINYGPRENIFRFGWFLPNNLVETLKWCRIISKVVSTECPVSEVLGVSTVVEFCRWGVP